uniref:Uncharacterized membrane protein n=1 Tax=Candidatus Kentrum sp. MB TaxID=2138164 RepID=A0A450XW16_9GAMM|nr:MAG: Uncharacterized membrane protein [Candidatus Kentron sp. MB]VFK33470.1 MAG: Uncharacterized membrane protein [Candidatus Kentron sp. MB]VFK76229.1 MAG: Uncharacterized membrane protein [Candidatus Kentron sp. MB]
MHEEQFPIHNERQRSVKRMATIVYALQAASFLVGITFLIAIIINYVKQADAQGTWLESHFRWQIRTFWFAFLWNVLGWMMIAFTIGYPIFLANFIWIIYRIVKGWIRLTDGEEMYV